MSAKKAAKKTKKKSSKKSSKKAVKKAAKKTKKRASKKTPVVRRVQTVAEVDVLGTARARAIVSNCAQSTAWQATLAELGLNPLIFRNCVASGVDNAGFVPPNVPATPDTRLIDVVAAIQGAPRQ